MRRHPPAPARHRSYNESDPDAANNETFGDLGDIKAGDKSSHAWESHHQTFAREREAQRASSPYLKQQTSHSPYVHSAEAVSPQPQHARYVERRTWQNPSIHSPNGRFNDDRSALPQQRPPPRTLPHPKFANTSYGHLRSLPVPVSGTVEPLPSSGLVQDGRMLGHHIMMQRQAPNIQANARNFPESIRPPPPELLPSYPLSRTDVSTGSVTSLSRHEFKGQKGSKLPSMTNRDIEFVLRMHMRQLETTDSYSDDYYNYAIQEKRRFGNDDTFAALSSISSHMRSSVAAKRKRRSTSFQDYTGDDPSASGEIRRQHAPENLEVLTSALGTLQLRNVKAPRMLMTFEKDDPNDIDKRTPKKLAEDERIVVRAAVEKGFDAIASVHDVCRGKSEDSVEILADSLYKVFCPRPGPKARPSLVVEMCTIPKGVKLILRALPLLSPKQQVKIVNTLICGISRIAELTEYTGDEDDMSKTLWEKLIAYIIDTVGNEKIPGLIVAFMHGHGDNANDMIAALSSSKGGSLISAVLQKMYALKRDELLSSNEVEPVMGAFCSTVIPFLGDAFRESKENSALWNVVAMLDALGPSDQQTRLRARLKQMLDTGQIDPPQS